jgi:ribosome-associated protein
MRSLQILPGWSLPELDFEMSFVRSSGPGGQNVNKVSTKVELRFFLDRTLALDSSQKLRLRESFPSHVTREGEFLLASDRFRSQARNIDDVRERLAEMLRSIRHPPRARLATRPSRGAKERRLQQKRRRSEVKRARRETPWS